jgi:hypothetical protein
LREVVHSLQGAVESDLRRRRRNGCFWGRCADTHPRFLEPTYELVWNGCNAPPPQHNTKRWLTACAYPRLRPRCVVKHLLSCGRSVGTWDCGSPRERDAERGQGPTRPHPHGPSEDFDDIPTSRTEKVPLCDAHCAVPMRARKKVVEVSIRCVGWSLVPWQTLVDSVSVVQRVCDEVRER